MIKIKLFTSKSGKELFDMKETFYAWGNESSVAPIPFTVCKEHTEDMGDNLIHVKDISSVKFGGVTK